MMATATIPRLIVILGIVCVQLARTQGQPENPLPLYRVGRASAAIAVDGVLSEFDWLVAERIRLIKFRHEPEDGKPLHSPTHVAALWDSQNLYLAFALTDREIWATLAERDARLFPEECVEFFVDPDADSRRYIETQINTAGNMRDLLVDYSSPPPSLAQFDVMAKWDYERMQKALKIHRDAARRDLGWTLEVAIPWTEFRFSRRSWPPRPGDEIRINFYRYERSRDGRLLEQSGWSRVQGTFHDAPRFGRFVFSAKPPGSEE